MASTRLFGTGGAPVKVAQWVDHVDHIVNLVGVEHVGLGLDLCDSFRNHLNVERSVSTNDVIQGHQELARITAALMERGYTDEDIMLILGGNFLRVYYQILG